MELTPTQRVYKVAIATHEKEPDFFRHPCAADHKIAEALQERNVLVDPVPWDKDDVNWSEYDAVVVRSTHDYIIKYEKFKQWIEYLREQNIPLYNTYDILKWNSHKQYLLELKDNGVDIIPTMFLEKGSKNCGSLIQVMQEQNWRAIAVKPCVSCNSYNTRMVMSHEEAVEFQDQFNTWLLERDVMLQKYIPDIKKDGEWSVIVIDKNVSHTILKKQVEGSLSMVENAKASPAPLEVVQFAEKIISYIKDDLLYGRVDIVQCDGKVTLMEIELIECLLFLNHHMGAAEAFTEAVIRRLQR